MIDNNTMNTIKAYKALSVVANVEQGEMIKRLIKENEELKKQKALMFKFQQAEVKILVVVMRCMIVVNGRKIHLMKVVIFPLVGFAKLAPKILIWL